MKIGWLLIGIIVAVLIFIFFPGLFDKLVSVVQYVIHVIDSLVHGGALNA